MENSTSSVLTLINNFAAQTIFNFNFNVVINLFIYSAAITFGVLVAVKIIEGLISFVHYKWTSRYERRAEEIKELNRKMHDRLVEIEDFIESNKEPENYTNIKTRLRYNASRLKKYDKAIFEDVNLLLENLLSSSKKEIIKELIEKIKGKVDKLWFKKS